MQENDTVLTYSQLCLSRASWLICFFPILFFGFSPLQGQQIGIYGDIFVGSGATLAIHQGSTNFYNGIIFANPSAPGQVDFYLPAQAQEVNNDSYVETSVRSLGHANFVFPVGDQGIYQPLAIQSTGNTTGDLSVNFHYTTPPTASLDAELDQINPNFYWAVEGDKVARVQLSWNNFSQLDQWVEELSALRMIAYNGDQWEVIPSAIESLTLDGSSSSSLLEGAIGSTSAVDFSQYTAFSLGAVALNTTLNISEAITPNGDGINDVWYIENIERYPQAIIRVYNRWGAEVFYQARPYANDWGGTYNDNNKPLPSAPYFYRIDQDGDGEIDHEGWIYINH